MALVLDGDVRVGLLLEYTHIAFTVPERSFQSLSERIRASGASIWQDNWTEGESLYFIDPNGHKLEIHTTGLAARLQAARRDPWEGLEFFTKL